MELLNQSRGEDRGASKDTAQSVEEDIDAECCSEKEVGEGGIFVKRTNLRGIHDASRAVDCIRTRIKTDDGARAKVSSGLVQIGGVGKKMSRLQRGAGGPRLEGCGFGDRGGGHEGEFDAAAHGVDALGADADAIAEFPGWRGDLFAARSAAAAVAARDGDDGVVALAEDAASVGGIFDQRRWGEAPRRRCREVDVAAVFLDGDDQAVVLDARCCPP